MVCAGGATAEISSSFTSTMRTPRAAAASRADGVTMASAGILSSPPAGISCAVITLRMKYEIQCRCTIRKDHCNEDPSPVASLSGGQPGVGPSHGQLQREPLQPH